MTQTPLLWETVIGLEIHAKLQIKTKLFGSEPYIFGSPPNTNIGMVSTGQPGSLPVLNEEAVKKGVLFGLAVHADIQPISRFDRKSYFYPDNPKNFQITQFEYPLLWGGSIMCEVEGEIKEFPLIRAHLEEDAAMLKHFPSYTGVDYNRAGVALLEIVSTPCFSSSIEASLFASSVKTLLEYLDICDGNMEEGSFRMDANVSIRKKGEKRLRPKTEIKNLNSFYNMMLAINQEIKRQIAFYEINPDSLLEKGTYRFDAETKELHLMRKKESIEDYRYFSEPDLPPIILQKSYIEKLRTTLPELPFAKYKRYTQELGLSSQVATFLTSSKKQATYFEEALSYGPNPKLLSNWITVEFAGKLKGKEIWQTGIPSQHVAELVLLVEQKRVTGKMAKTLVDKMIQEPQLSPQTIVQENPDYMLLEDPKTIEALVDTILAKNPQSLKDFIEGKDKALTFLVGEVLTLSEGKASPPVVHQIILLKLEKIKREKEGKSDH